MLPWVSAALATAACGAQRLDERCRRRVDHLSQQPSVTFPAASRGHAAGAAADRFRANDRGADAQGRASTAPPRCRASANTPW